MTLETNLLIMGAGPFGLALSAQASHQGLEHLIVGKAMEFWRQNMPKGMYLRSNCDWHLDPLNRHTIKSFIQARDKTQADVEPLSLEFYQSYVEWFQEQKQITPSAGYIRRLDYSAANETFIAAADGTTIHARHVVVAPGFKYFAHVPQELAARIPGGRFSHTCDFVDFSAAQNRRYLIVGGRQSAFEWAALLTEAGAATVHLSHRHPSPAFKTSDWSWVPPMVDAIVDNPGWFRNLTQDEKDNIGRRLWTEGRSKLEPWLEPRLNNDRVKIWPETELKSCREQEGGELLAELTNGETVAVDHVILATGYKVDITRLPFLSAGNILNQLVMRNGFPVLDDHFQTSVPGLFITSMPATQDFGPFFAFTVSVRASATLICESISAKTGHRVMAENSSQLSVVSDQKFGRTGNALRD